MQKTSIAGVLLPSTLLQAKHQFRACETNWHAVYQLDLHAIDCRFVRDPTRLRHQIDRDVVVDADDDPFRDVFIA